MSSVVKVIDGKIVLVKEDKKPVKVSFIDKLAIKSLVDMFIKYDTKFKADDYYKAQYYDNYSSYISILYDYYKIDDNLNMDQLDPSNIVMYTILLEEERMRHNLRALDIKIKDIEIAFAMIVELLRLIIIKLNELGFDTKIVSNDTLIWLYCDIISNNGRAITFIGEEHLETYTGLRKLFSAIIMPEYANKINSYIKYREV